MTNEDISIAEASIKKPVVKKRRRNIRRISYLTDVEGDKHYLDRFVLNSDILTFEPVRERTNNDGDEDEASKHLKFPYEQQITFISSDNDEEDNIETVCVFGGDIWDKGGNDLYVIRQLISFRQRYGPERVIFIMGNRDINKMRIFAEVVGCSRDFNEPPTHGGLFWRKGTGKIGDPDLIK